MPSPSNTGASGATTSLPRAPACAAFRGRIGVARSDITPPLGIYARNWGAAPHDTAASIHRPLSLTAFSLRSAVSSRPLLLIDADLGWWRALDAFRAFRSRVLTALTVQPQSILFALSHTHAGPPLGVSDPALPGGQLLAEYLDHVVQAAVDATNRAMATETDGLLEWHTGRCQLAAARDLLDPIDTDQRLICGYDPTTPADTTLLLGRATEPNGNTLATLVHYACHPTTLAWENRAISPDFVGAMRETIEQATGGAPALFLQGASGELAPRYQYVGEPRIADRHGRQLAFAALATLEDMEPPGMRLAFDRVVESGAPLAIWRHRPAAAPATLRALDTHVDLPLKPWPTAEQLERRLATCSDRTIAERLRRQRDVRHALGDGTTYPLPIHAWRMGDALLVGSMAEAYSLLQRELRRRYPHLPVVCMNLVNGSIGYLPPAELYDRNVYQVWQTPFARGSLEMMIEAMAAAIDALLTDGSETAERD